MEMSIEESLINLKELQKDYQQFHDDVWQDPESYGIMAESLQVAIDTMRKYQKIEQIVKEWDDSGLLQNQLYDKLHEVVEDGKNNRDVR